MSFEKFRRLRKPIEDLFGKIGNTPAPPDGPFRRPPTVSMSTEEKLALMEKESNEANIPVDYPKMTTTIYSYYADFQQNNYYKNYALNLIDRCKKFGVAYNISERTSRGSYGANCLMKPEFVLEKLKESKAPLIWMDCDTDFKSSFSEFNNISEDIGMATHSGDLSGIKASPLFFNYTAGSFKIIREWVVHCRSSFLKGIPELDHDALKHYVLPHLRGNYSVFLLSQNWNDFVHGKYIHNGNSRVDGKMETHRQVGVDDDTRARYSRDVKTFHVYFEEKSEIVFSSALKFLNNFSDYARLKFHFDQGLEKISCSSLEFHKLYTESGGNTTFSENNFTDHSPLNGEIILGVSGVKDIEKDWDSKISGEIQGGRNPLYVLNYKDDGLGKITIKEGFSLWN
jgi:hypothetical protein